MISTPNSLNILWLTKVSLVRTTAQESINWGMMTYPLLGSSDEKAAHIDLATNLAPAMGGVHITTNYETMNSNKCRAKLSKIKWHAIIVDEVHRLRGGANPTPTQIWENTKNFIHAQESDHPVIKLFLSGSILNNKPEELWAYLHIFNPVQFKSKREFARIFAEREYIKALGVTQSKLLSMLSGGMIRRRMDEVAQEMPEQVVLPPEYIDLDPKSELGQLIHKLHKDVLIEIDSIPDDMPFTVTSMLAKLHYLRAASLAHGVLKYTPYTVDPETLERVKQPRQDLLFNPPYTKLDYIAGHVRGEGSTGVVDEYIMQGENVIIFSAQFNGPLDYLHDLFTKKGYKSAVIKGGTDHSQIQEDFQQNRLQVVLINLKSGAEGLNLQRSSRWPGGASHTIFLDQWWNPAMNEQGWRRTRRIDTLGSTFIHNFFLKGTVDELIEDICQGKIAENEGITEATALRAGDWKEKLRHYLK